MIIIFINTSQGRNHRHYHHFYLYNMHILCRRRRERERKKPLMKEKAHIQVKINAINRNESIAEFEQNDDREQEQIKTTNEESKKREKQISHTLKKKVIVYALLSFIVLFSYVRYHSPIKIITDTRGAHTHVHTLFCSKSLL